MGRKPCCDKIGLKRGPWTIEEDHKLMNFMLNNGIHCWRLVPKLAGLLRCGKSCRLRWINYLRPDLKRGALSELEENLIIQLHSRLGNRWSKIAAHFPGRTDNEIKNHWNTRIKKRLRLIGIDPLTHKPIVQKKEKTETLPSNDHGDEELSLEDGVMSMDSNYAPTDVPETIEKSDKVELINSIETSNILNNYEMLSENFDVGLWLDQETNTAASTCSSSISREDSLNRSSMGEPPLNIQDQENSLQQWVDSVESFLSWDVFNNLDQDLLFLQQTL